MHTEMTADAYRPVRWSDEAGAFLVSGFEEASAVLRGSGWSVDPRLSPYAPPDFQELPPGALPFMDPPDHTRLRTPLAPLFTPRAIERLRSQVVAVVDSVLDGLDESKPVDILREVGYPIPLAILGELLSVGSEGAEIFRKETPKLFRLMEMNPTEEDLQVAVMASAQLSMYLIPILKERQEQPRDDFITGLLAVEGISLEEVMSLCLTLLAAGHETTANFITNGTLAMLRHSEQRELLLADPKKSVEELLRLEGAVKLTGRVAVTDHELGGQHISEGQLVYVQLHQANRDPKRFADPERLDLARESQSNLAFGGGPHFCLGAALARMEAVETFSRLFTRFPDMALASESAEWRDSTTFHGVRKLNVWLRS